MPYPPFQLLAIMSSLLKLIQPELIGRDGVGAEQAEKWYGVGEMASNGSQRKMLSINDLRIPTGFL